MNIFFPVKLQIFVLAFLSGILFSIPVPDTCIGFLFNQTQYNWICYETFCRI